MFVVDDDKQFGMLRLRSLQAFATDHPLMSFGAAAVYERPSRKSLQISEHEHIELLPTFLAFINHSCAPNIRFDIEGQRLIATRPIAAGDEVTFFYPSTEWVMAAPFHCHCGSLGCLSWISGASQLPRSVLQGHLLCPHIVRLLKNTNARWEVPA